MPYPLDDTIAAIASPPGGAARGIVRLSGPDTTACVRQVFRTPDGQRLGPVRRNSILSGTVSFSPHAPPLPCGLYLWPGAHSYTGQPVAEIHTLGCRPLLEALLRRLLECGARLANPGEFTLRAFLAGRLDLTQAEAVLGVIDAVDRRQFDVAVAQLAGGLGTPLGGLRDALLELLAHLEAGFDFADEDLPFITSEELDRQLADATATIARLARQTASRTETTHLVRAVLVGWPNTGKSSLLNVLVTGSDALVSDQPGTTRDYLTAELNLDGLKCTLVDTAGVEPIPHGPEDSEDSDTGPRRAAQRLSARQTELAHVEILCLDCTRPTNAWEKVQLTASRAERVLVATKIDLGRRDDLEPGAIATSSVTGEGIDTLRARLREAALAAAASDADVVAGTAVRCRESLRLAAECLDRARRLVQDALGEELVAAELRVALDELGKVVGAVYTDDVLDRIFSRFCVGK